jgi:GT2 family glycosyltransferase
LSTSTRNTSLSIVIVSWNTADLTSRCLSSIAQSDIEEVPEVVVVDNNSTDGSAARIESEFPSVTLLKQSKNLGYAAANNLGFRKTSGEFILTLNPDTRLKPDALSKAIAIMQKDPSAGVVAAQLLNEDGTTQRSVRGFPSWAGIFGTICGLDLLFPGSVFDSYRLRSFDYAKPAEVEQPMGTFLLFRRTALQEIGRDNEPFDEQFPIFFNEVDLLKALKDSGWKIRYEPSVQVFHVGGASTRQRRPQMIWESHRSLLRYFHKHDRSFGEKLVTAVITPVVLGSALLRAKGLYGGFELK